MKTRLLNWFLLIAICIMPFAQSGSASAEQGSGPYLVFFPLIETPSHLFLPAMYNDYPKAWDGPVGGTIPTIIYDPILPNIVYLGSWDGGVYKSFDGGEHWVQMNNGLPSVEINTIAIDPSNPNILYVGPYAKGLYKSIDGGETWVNVSKGLQNPGIVYSIAIDPTNSDNVYISTRNYDNPFHPPWQGIVYKSNDGGASWSPSLVNAGGSGEQDWIYSLAIDTRSPNTIYAAAHETGAYRSTDSGNTWKAINTGIFDLTGRSIVIDKGTSNPTTLYMGVWHRTGVFTSADSGGHWNVTGGMGDVKIYTISMVNSTLYAATANHGLYRSTNSGASWRNVGFDGQFFYCVVINPSDPNLLLAGASGLGVWKSIDAGSHWSQVVWGFSDTASFTSQSEMPEPFDD